MTVVIGIGNLLLKDEGAGIHAVRELRKNLLPPGVEVVDGGLGGISLLDLFEGAGKVVIIDAAEMGRKPGNVARFTPEEVRLAANTPRFSTHDLALPEVLDLARGLGKLPREVVIFGIQPKEISWGEELTAEVNAALGEVLNLVMQEIDSKRGLPLRDQAGDP